MARLREQGRSNVLVVPAVFCADAETMRRMRDQVSEHDGQMSIAWLPGLGGQLAEGD